MRQSTRSCLVFLCIALLFGVCSDSTFARSIRSPEPRPTTAVTPDSSPPVEAGKGATPAAPAAAPDRQRYTSLKINVYAIVSPEIETQVKSVSDHLLATVGLKTFAAAGQRVHCTLFLTQYEPDQTDGVKAIAASLAARLAPFAITTTGLSRTKDDWLFIDIKRNEALQQLSNRLTVTLSPMRAKNVPIPGWVKAYPEKEAYAKLFGSPNVFTQFEPHLTLLAKTEKAPLDTFFASLPATGPLAASAHIEGKVIGIGVGLADRNGQISDIYAEYPLAGSGRTPSRSE